MRLKFIEYIINAACCECRCDATREADRSFIAIFTRFSNPGRGAQPSIGISPTTSPPRLRVLSLHRTIGDSFLENIRARAIYLKRRKIDETMLLLARKGCFAYATWNFQWKRIKPQWKSWFPHFPGAAPLPANSVESGGKGNGISRSSLSFYLSYPPPNPASPPLWNIPPTPSCNLAPSKRASTFPSAALAVSL